MWQTRVSYVDCAYITLVNTELGFRLFKLGISNFWFRFLIRGLLPWLDYVVRFPASIPFGGVLPSFNSVVWSWVTMLSCVPMVDLEERLCGAVQRWWRGSDCDPDCGVVLWLLLYKVSNFWLSFIVVLFFISLAPHNRMKGAHLRMESKQGSAP